MVQKSLRATEISTFFALMNLEELIFCLRTIQAFQGTYRVTYDATYATLELKTHQIQTQQIPGNLTFNF